MSTNRLEAFSDGVLAIIITIMVLELKVPHGADWQALAPVIPVLLCYVLSFVYVGIYWNNHHHLLKACPRVDARIMWANLNLLFWLSLLPFVTGWMGENHFEPLPTACYGAVLLFSAAAYFLLQQLVLALHPADAKIRLEFSRDWKGRISLFSYLIAIPLALFAPVLANAIFVAVAIMWCVPDRRIERTIASET